MPYAGNYPKSYNLGNKNLEGFFEHPIYVQEKIDGSQFSFGYFDGKLRCWSRAQELNLLNPGMFKPAIDALLDRDPLAFMNECTYRGEFLARPRHNHLAYDRIPKQHVVLFDVQDKAGEWLIHAELCVEGQRLGFDVAPVYMLWNNQTDSESYLLEEIKKLVATMKPVLGGEHIEGVVLKSYQRNADGHVMFGKYVRPEYREEAPHKKPKKGSGTDEFLAALAYAVTGPARWEKALQHLRDGGVATGEMQDMPLLIQEVNADIYLECSADFETSLLVWALPKMKQHFIKGLAEWYKDKLLEQITGEIHHGQRREGNSVDTETHAPA